MVDLESSMLYIIIQLSWRFLGSGEEDFCLPYMGRVAILFNDAEPFEQIDNIPSTEHRMWKLVKIGPAVSEKKILITRFYTCM